MKKPIYFDYNATTPLDPRVIEVMSRSLHEDFGNAASRSHSFGWKAEQLIDAARAHVARLIGADPKEIVWTSGATEANNLALKGAAHFYQDKGKHIITSQTEHKAVLDTCRQLEREGFEVTYIRPNHKGVIALETIAAAIRPDTILLSIMHANNEIGVIQDIAAMGELARRHGIIFHVDAAQSAGKLLIDLSTVHQHVDLLSLCAHKFYGPKGIGALYVRRKPRIRLEAQIHGGGHERGMRSGTLATHQIVGMGEAARIAKAEYATESKRIAQLRDRLWNGIKDIEKIEINGDQENRLAGTLNISIHFVEGESLIMGLKELAISSGSACTSSSLEPSYVLKALGLKDELAHSSLRFSLGRFTSAEEVDRAIILIRGVVEKLRNLSPLWEMYQEGVDLNTIIWAEH